MRRGRLRWLWWRRPRPSGPGCGRRWLLERLGDCAAHDLALRSRGRRSHLHAPPVHIALVILRAKRYWAARGDEVAAAALALQALTRAEGWFERAAAAIDRLRCGGGGEAAIMGPMAEEACAGAFAKPPALEAAPEERSPGDVAWEALWDDEEGEEDEDEEDEEGEEDGEDEGEDEGEEGDELWAAEDDDTLGARRWAAAERPRALRRKRARPAIARAVKCLSRRPVLLCMDDPTSGTHRGA